MRSFCVALVLSLLLPSWAGATSHVVLIDRSDSNEIISGTGSNRLAATLKIFLDTILETDWDELNVELTVIPWNDGQVYPIIASHHLVNSSRLWIVQQIAKVKLVPRGGTQPGAVLHNLYFKTQLAGCPAITFLTDDVPNNKEDFEEELRRTLAHASVHVLVLPHGDHAEVQKYYNGVGKRMGEQGRLRYQSALLSVETLRARLQEPTACLIS